MHVDQKLTQLAVGSVVGLVAYDKEQVEPGHDGRRDIEVLLQVF